MLLLTALIVVSFRVPQTLRALLTLTLLLPVVVFLCTTSSTSNGRYISWAIPVLLSRDDGTSVYGVRFHAAIVVMQQDLTTAVLHASPHLSVTMNFESSPSNTLTQEDKVRA